VDVDADADFTHAGKLCQSRFGALFDRLRDARVIRREGHLHGHIRAFDPHILDESERNDIAAEAGIFDGGELGADLVLRDHERAMLSPRHAQTATAKSQLNFSIFSAWRRFALIIS
jgi:hypothetical protein